MYLYLIKLKEILNNPSTLDLTSSYLKLNKSKKPPLLIYGKELGEAILKSENFIPISLIEYFKVINNISDIQFPSIERYFREAPLFLRNPAQSDTRKALSILYKNIENNLLSWLPDFTEKYFNKIKNGQNNDPVLIAEEYTYDVFKQIILTEFDCKTKEFIEFPGGILNTYKNRESLVDYDRKLNTLFKFIEKKLKLLDRPQEDAWQIISIAVMGTEPLFNSLAFAMFEDSNHERKWNAEALFYEASPISFVARLCTKESKINNVIIQKNQDVYVTLSLINQLKLNQDTNIKGKTSVSFGQGKHMCPGRKISLMIAQTFLEAWERYKDIKIKTSQINISRDLVLRLKKKNERLQ